MVLAALFLQILQTEPFPVTTTTTEPEIRRLSNGEFIALLAMLFATVAFSIDSMLPSLPRIAAELTPQDHNRAQLILTSFVLGMGLGTFFMGPLSDAFGRKRVLLTASTIYCLAALACFFAPNLETLLLARMVGGFGASGPRVISLAIVRDLYKGRDMARIMSFAMMVFAVIPAAAPLVGSFIIGSGDWRVIFLAFICFAGFSALWLTLRQPETLPASRRLSLSLPHLSHSLKEVLTNRIVVTSIAVQALAFAALFSMISSVQQVFDITFDMAKSFPYWFTMIAVVSASASFMNANLVGRLGMRFLIKRTLSVQCILSCIMLAVWLSGALQGNLLFAVFMLWMLSVFLGVGLTLGNLNALAMEPLGHIAGFAASAIGAIATVISVALAAPIGLAFDGTPVPLIASNAALTGLAFLLMLTLPAPQQR